MKWLFKSEPEEFSLSDLRARPRKTEPWDGVRNYQARNMMRDQMQVGDEIFFYHSRCEVPGIVGVAKVASGSYPDPTAFDPQDKHFDPKSDPDNPRWFLVDVKYVRGFKRTVSLTELKTYPELAEFQLVKRGNRLSVMPVPNDVWTFVLDLEQLKV